MKYYRLLNDLDIPDRWFLGEIDSEDAFDFWKYIKAGKVVDPKNELSIKLREEGLPLDFTMADFELLVVNEKVATLLSKTDVQLLPITIDGLKTDNKFHLVVIKNELACIDEDKSDFTKWEPNNDIRPDKAGQYSGFFKLIVDPVKIEGNDIFRIKDFNVAIIVSENLKNKLETNHVIGVKFKEVTP